MTDALVITIPGQPVPKARARVTRAGWAYTPKKTRLYEATVKKAAQTAMRGRDLLTGAVAVTVLAVLSIPQSWPTKKRMLALTGELQPTGRPDVDNLAKSFLDASNGVIFEDDAQVVELVATKRYGLEPKLKVTIEGVG